MQFGIRKRGVLATVSSLSHTCRVKPCCDMFVRWIYLFSFPSPDNFSSHATATNFSLLSDAYLRKLEISMLTQFSTLINPLPPCFSA